MSTPTTTAANAASTVYDGTWDATTSTYLLAPLVGLPFDEMVKNGMGARHAGDHLYLRLILVHGLFAAFAFLVFIPAALVCARFLLHGPTPRLAMWGHIGFQVMSIICLTITFVSGYFAVGKANWGSNPHHIIGTTIYAAIIVQAFFGVFVRWRAINRFKMDRVSLDQMVHQWFGRCIFFLGLAQIPLGLYLYGSPLALFVLYAVCVFMFLCIWFLCEYLRMRGWFTRGFGGKLDPEMSELERHTTGKREPDAEAGEASMGETPTATPKRSRFSKLSFLGRRRSLNVPAWNYEEGSTSMETSRAPSAQSPGLVGGLQPQPGRQANIPPVPPLPPNEDYSGSGSLVSGEIHRDDNDRFFWKGKAIGSPPKPLREGVLRDSGTLGGGPPYQEPPLQMPEPQFPQPYDSPAGLYPTPPHGGGYVEDSTGFVPSPVDQPPLIPLPHRPTRSIDNTNPNANASVPRLPTSHSTENLVAAGGTDRPSQPPKVAVQVKLNADGKSVSVRKLNPEEAEREHRERERARAERASQKSSPNSGGGGGGGGVVSTMPPEEAERRALLAERAKRAAAREMEIERARAVRAHQHQRQDSYDSVGGLSMPDPSGYMSEGGQSSTIAERSGGLLGGARFSKITPGQMTSPLIGMQPPPPQPQLGGNGGNGNGGNGGSGGNGIGQAISGSAPTSSVVSAENSEIENEILKEQRRSKRRQERRDGMRAGGGYAPPEEQQWT